MIRYPKRFSEHMSIRPEVKLEGTFVQEVLPTPVSRPITPLVAQFVDVDCSCSISCLSLLETSADKLSALVWRVLSRDRNSARDDVTIIRHMYDLYCLSTVLSENLSSIVVTAKVRYAVDRKRGYSNCPEGFEEALSATCDVLIEDKLYKEEYEHYVLNMCFGTGRVSGYETVLESLNTFKTIL